MSCRPLKDVIRFKMSLIRYFSIFIILIVGLGHSAYSSALDSLLSPNPPKYALTPIVLFKSIDPLMPDRPNNLLLSADNNQLYFIGSKGIYNINLITYSLQFQARRLYNSKYHSNPAIYPPIDNPYLNSIALSDSAKIITLNSENKLMVLRGVKFTWGKPLPVNGYTIFGIHPSEEIVYDVSDQTIFFTPPKYYGNSPFVFPFSDFLIYERTPRFDIFNFRQINDFRILNLIKGKDGFHYVTAINDQYFNIPYLTPSGNTRIGGSEIKGTIENPNIYKFKDGKYLDGTDYTEPLSSSKAKTLLIGKGNCVYVDKMGHYYTVSNDRVLKWQPNSDKSEIVAGGNGIGNGLNQLNINLTNTKPLEIDEDGNMFICDYYNKRVVYWPRDAKSGEIVVGENKNSLNNLLPTSVIIDKDKNIYVSDEGSNQVYKFQSCLYLGKPIIQQIPSSIPTTYDLYSPNLFPTRFYLNNNLIPNEGKNILSLKKSGYYKVQAYDSKGCKSIVSDSIYFECIPEKPQVQVNSKTELTALIPSESKMYSRFGYQVFSTGLVRFFNDSRNFDSNDKSNLQTWTFPDGSTSTELSPTKQFSKSGKYFVKLEVKNAKGELSVYGNYVQVYVPINPLKNEVVNIPIHHYENMWEDISGNGNHGSFNGKINQLTNQGLLDYQPTFSSINLPGCNTENLNERIKISNSESLKNLKEVTFSGWFAIDKSISMSPNDGSCGINGSQVLFSKGGDGYGTSLPGFNSLLEIKNNDVFLNLEFSKNSGNFLVRIPINKFLDTLKKNELFEAIEFISGKYFEQGNLVNSITRKPRIGELVNPFQHFVISFSENILRVFINGKLVFDENRSIKFDEINNQDLYVGAMGPKATPVNKIFHWYPFKGRIDKLIVLNKLVGLNEANILFNNRADD